MLATSWRRRRSGASPACVPATFEEPFRRTGGRATTRRTSSSTCWTPRSRGAWRFKDEEQLEVARARGPLHGGAGRGRPADRRRARRRCSTAASARGTSAGRRSRPEPGLAHSAFAGAADETTPPAAAPSPSDYRVLRGLGRLRERLRRLDAEPAPRAATRDRETPRPRRRRRRPRRRATAVVHPVAERRRRSRSRPRARRSRRAPRRRGRRRARGSRCSRPTPGPPPAAARPRGRRSRPARRRAPSRRRRR